MLKQSPASHLLPPQLLKMLDTLLGESGVILELSMGSAPEREVQHLALRCLNNMLNRLDLHQSISFKNI